MDETTPVPLELWPENEVVVHVADELGRPVAGVPVGASLSGVIRDTAADGSAAIRWSLAYRGQTRDAPETFLAFPLVDPVRRQLDSAPEAPEEVTFVLPPVGRIFVPVTMNGEPVPDGTLVYLVRKGSYLLSRDGFFVAETRGSIAEFWPVGIGTELEAYVQPWKQMRRFFVAGPGPGSRGETVTLHLDVDVHELSIMGRVVAEEGVRPTDELHGLVHIDGEQYPFTFVLDPDEEGRFTQKFVAGSGERGRLEIILRGRRRIELPLPAPDEDGIVDLGELHIAGSLRGVVVDPQGEPVSQGSVWTGRPSTSSSLGWLSGRGHALDAEGRFSLNDDEPEQDLWLHVEGVSELWRHEPVPWDRHQAESRLVLEPAGVIAARILLPNGASGGRHLFAIVWRQPGPDGDRRERPEPPYFMHGIDSGGAIRFRSLKPGEYTFAVYLSGEHFKPPLVRVDGIQVSAGEITEDARLSRIDLRDALSVIDLRVRDERGSDVPARALAYVNDGDTWSLGTTETPIVIPKRDELRRILVYADGYFPVTLEPPGATADVTLKRGLPVSLRVRGAPVLEAPHRLVAIIEAHDAPPRRSFSFTRGPDRGGLDAQGRLELRVPEAGEYRVRIGVEQDLRGYVSWEDVTPAGAPSLRVVEGVPNTVELTVDPAAVLQGVQRLRDR